MGDQGGRKSSFWAVLGGPFYSDALGDCSSKDDLMILHRSWLMEWAELDHVTSRKHAGSIKAFLTQATDIFRVPYGRSTESFPRRGIIVGSTNRQTGFLQDETGNRRFWIIPTPANETNPIDTPNLAAERDAIWSAAVHAYRAGEPSYLPAHLASKVEQENLAYQAEHPWKAVVEDWLATPAALAEVITSEKILTAAVQKPVERQTRADQMQVANLMRELGFVKRRVTVGSAQRWAFVRP
jgi:predicted P-loop ATPase